MTPPTSYENVYLDAGEREQRGSASSTRPAHPDAPSAGAQQVAGAHPGDALLSGVDAETVGVHVQHVQRPSPAARTDRTFQYRAKRSDQPATGKFGITIIVWIIVLILMSVMRQFR